MTRWIHDSSVIVSTMFSTQDATISENQDVNTSTLRRPKCGEEIIRISQATSWYHPIWWGGIVLRSPYSLSPLSWPVNYTSRYCLTFMSMPRVSTSWCIWKQEMDRVQRDIISEALRDGEGVSREEWELLLSSSSSIFLLLLLEQEGDDDLVRIWFD